MYPMRLQSFSYKNRYFLKAFLLGVAVSFLFFLPFIIYDQGYFLYYGDFNVQQVPFYQMIHDAIRSGNFSWSWTTDLGCQYHRFLFLLFIGQPLFLADPSFPQRSGPLFDGASADPEIRVRFPHRLYLSAPLCPGTGVCLDRGHAIRFFRFFRI